MKKLIFISLLMLTGCTTQNKQHECFYIARDLEDHLYFTDNCHIDNGLYCEINGKIERMYEVEYICEVEYGE